MSRVSKYIKITPEVLCEYIYDDQNLISEKYNILVNTRDGTKSFMSYNTSGTLNTVSNNAFSVDPIENKYGLIEPTTYNYLQLKDYSEGIPMRYDTLKIHFPVNYTFGEYLGIKIRVYTLDYNNEYIYDICNYIFDKTDVDRFNQLDFSSPQLLFQEQLWGKDIEIMIPSIYSLGKQRENGSAEDGTINSNLTDGVGISLSSPILIDFEFITKKDIINNTTTYLCDSPRTISFPQVPEFENLGVRIEESSQGDFFEIYGIFNDTIGDFNKFIEDSYFIGKRYYVEYFVTMYEENIRGKSSTYLITEQFNEPVEFRPIIKFSTTTAVIDVEMKLINQVDNSQISRKASYGLFGDQLSKYSLNLSKINVDNVTKPKIYSVKNAVGLSSLNNDVNDQLYRKSNVQFEKVKVPYPVLISTNNIISKSDNVVVGKNKWYGKGNLQIVIYPFDNIIKFILASEVDNDSTKIEYMDVSGSSEINLIFKNTKEQVKCELYSESDEVNLSGGVLVFKLDSKKVNSVRKIYESGINAFYITTNFNDNTSVYYSGTFIMFDSSDNLISLNTNKSDEALSESTSDIIIDPDGDNIREKAIITRRQVLKSSKIPNPLRNNGTSGNKSNDGNCTDC